MIFVLAVSYYQYQKQTLTFAFTSLFPGLKDSKHACVISSFMCTLIRTCQKCKQKNRTQIKQYMGRGKNLISFQFTSTYELKEKAISGIRNLKYVPRMKRIVVFPVFQLLSNLLIQPVDFQNCKSNRELTHIYLRNFTDFERNSVGLQLNHSPPYTSKE